MRSTSPTITTTRKMTFGLSQGIMTPISFAMVTAHQNKKPDHPVFQGNPACALIPRQPGHLLETRGFPSPSHERFGFISG